MEESGKKYFWLKLHKGFFKRHDIQIIESMPNGKDYVLFYLKLLVESIDHDGMLRFNDAIPYNEGMLATITNTNVDIVRSAIKIMESLGLLEVLDDGSFYMRQIETFTGSVTQWAEKKRIYREHKKLLQSGQSGGQKEDMSDKSKSKEIEKDLEIKKEKRAKTRSPEAHPTIEEVALYCKERNNSVDPNKWFDHYASIGWKIGGRSKMVDWKAAVRTWERSEYNKPRSPVQQTKGTKFDPSRLSQTVEYL